MMQYTWYTSGCFSSYESPVAKQKQRKKEAKNFLTDVKQRSRNLCSTWVRYGKDCGQVVQLVRSVKALLHNSKNVSAVNCRTQCFSSYSSFALARELNSASWIRKCSIHSVNRPFKVWPDTFSMLLSTWCCQGGKFYFILKRGPTPNFSLIRVLSTNNSKRCAVTTYPSCC